MLLVLATGLVMQVKFRFFVVLTNQANGILIPVLRQALVVDKKQEDYEIFVTNIVSDSV
jgi:hypothetical protein